jgi:hypothetical protein
MISHDVPDDEHLVSYEIGGRGGISTAVLKTINSRIEVGLVGYVEAKGRKAGGGCLIC